MHPGDAGDAGGSDGQEAGGASTSTRAPHAHRHTKNTAGSAKMREKTFAYGWKNMARKCTLSATRRRWRIVAL